MMKKGILQWMMIIIGVLSVSISTRATQVEDEQRTLIEHASTDIKVIPDKYNTGCTDDLIPVQMDTENGTTINDILFIAGSNGTRHVLDFYYRNKEIEGTIYIEGYDFSDFSLWSYNEEKVERTIKVVFNNCKFSGVVVGKAEGNISFEFNNCTLTSFSGGNTVFNRCNFGGTYSDGLVPFRNIQVNDCFFSDMGSMAAADKEVHTDGTQIYGIAGIDVEDVSYSNCRFEIPPLSVEGSTAYINACIMFQLEYSNAKNVSFTDCIVNGGGYSIYARGKGDGFICDNVSFQGIRFGCSKRYGIFYTDIHPDIAIKDVQQTDTLYIGSVWKENGETHLSVTNDTNQERTLQVYTDTGEYTYTIPACLTGSELVSEENLYVVSYSDMPFDMDIVIPEDCQYIVCFDNTIEGCGTQIRYKNWTEEAVYLNNSIIELMTGGENDILSEGQCGNNITYTLTKAGVLTLTGTGNTFNYHSAKFPEWTEYIDYIKEIRVEEGIEGLGSMIFRNCTSLKTVSLPSTLQTIGQRVFAGCVSLTELILPANIKSLGTAVCSGTVLQEIYYTGENWDTIELGTGNENMDMKVVYYYNGQVYYRINYILNDTEVEPASNGNPTTYLAGDELLFKNPVRDGYTFDGWYAEEALLTKLNGIETNSSGNVKVYAKWTKNPVVYNITYMLDGGTNATNNVLHYTEGAEVQLFAPVKEGYTFEGWYKDSSYSGDAISVISADTTGDITIYAKWSQIISSTQSDNNVSDNNSNNSGINDNNAEEVAEPARVKSLKLKRKSKNSLKISWKRDKSVSGYQIAIKTGKKGKYKIVKTIKKNKTIAYTKKKLKKGKKYFVKVRAYKIVDGVKVYGDYSKVRSITLR